MAHWHLPCPLVSQNHSINHHIHSPSPAKVSYSAEIPEKKMYIHNHISCPSPQKTKRDALTDGLLCLLVGRGKEKENIQITI